MYCISYSYTTYSLYGVPYTGPLIGTDHVLQGTCIWGHAPTPRRIATIMYSEITFKAKIPFIQSYLYLLASMILVCYMSTSG